MHPQWNLNHLNGNPIPKMVLQALIKFPTDPWIYLVTCSNNYYIQVPKENPTGQLVESMCFLETLTAARWQVPGWGAIRWRWDGFGKIRGNHAQSEEMDVVKSLYWDQFEDLVSPNKNGDVYVIGGTWWSVMRFWRNSHDVEGGEAARKKWL